MAIQKTKSLPNGSTGNYWKITSETCDRLKLTCAYVITLFTDKTHADNGSPSLGLSKKYVFTCTKGELAQDLTALGYDKIKTKAASIVTPPTIRGITTPAPYMYDSDLSGGTDV